MTPECCLGQALRAHAVLHFEEEEQGEDGVDGGEDVADDPVPGDDLLEGEGGDPLQHADLPHQDVPGELLIDLTIPFTLNCEVKSTTLARGMERKMKRTRKVLRSQ